MRLIDLRQAIDAGDVLTVEIWRTSDGWTLEAYTVEGRRSMALARGGRRIFASLDATVRACEEAGWAKPITLRLDEGK